MTEGIIQFNEWSKIDLRVGKIIEVDDVEEADKLYKLVVDIGEEQRIICAGLKQHYQKKELKDKKIILFTNLAPRKMKGILSEGMLLAAVNEKENQVVLISPEDDIDIGSRVS